jgi:hypothetical protein
MGQTTISTPAHGPALADALLAAIPALAPAVNPATGEREARLRIWRDDDGLHLDWPADVAESAVQAVIAAHDPEQPSAGEQAATAAALDVSDLLTSAAQAAQLLGWNAGTRSWAAAGAQWDTLTPAQRTTFMRRCLRAVVALAQRQGGG